jgi:C-terminal processing protease CtpA/Prc
MNLRAVAVAVLTLLTFTLAPAHGEDAKGFFGLAVAIDGKGFVLNPTLRSVTVQKVEPKSPAANAGIAPGDQIVEVEGKTVAGTKAKELQPLMQKKVGQSLHLVLKHPNGETFKVVLIAIARPAEK